MAGELRKFYKKADSVIEELFIWPIHYPEDTNFIRKLLKIKPKRPVSDTSKDFRKNLPNIIDKLKTELENDPELKHDNGELLISEYEMRLLIYERIMLKGVTQLGLTQEYVDACFLEYNTEKLKELYSKLDAKNEKSELDAEFLASVSGFLEIQIDEAIPPHLIDFTKIAAAKPPDNADVQEHIDAYNSSLDRNVANHIDLLKKNIKHYTGLQGREQYLESSLKQIIAFNEYLETQDDYKSSALDDAEIQEYRKLLEKTQKTIFERNKKSHDTRKHKPKKKLTNFEKRAIATYTKIKTDSNYQLTEAEKKLLADFFEYATDNKEFNKRLGRILKQNDSFIKTNILPIKEIYKFTYKTSFQNLAMDAVERVVKTSEYLDKGTELPENEVCSHLDIGHVEKFSSLSPILKILHSAKVTDHSTKLKDMATQTAKLRNDYLEFRHHMEKKSDMKSKVKSGDLLFLVDKKYNRLFMMLKTCIFDRIADWITPYSHTATVIVEDEHLKQSHILHGGYSKGSLVAFDSIMVDEIYRISPIKLMNAEYKDKVCKTFGIKEEELEEKLEEMFAFIAEELNKDSEYGLIKGKPEDYDVSTTKQVKAGIADFIPLGHKRRKTLPKWAKEVLEDPNKLQQDPSLCSSFSAKMTVLTIISMNNMIASEIKEKHPDFDENTEIFKLPLGKHEDLEKVHPQRLLKELKKHGAVKRIKVDPLEDLRSR